MNPALLATLVQVLGPVLLREIPTLLPVIIRVLSALHEHAQSMPPAAASSVVAGNLRDGQYLDGHFIRSDEPGA